MEKQELELLESKLQEKGYKQYYNSKYSDNTAYEYMKSFEGEDYDEEGYLVIYQVWDFERYRPGMGYGVSVVVMPETPTDLGRRDLLLDYRNYQLAQIDKIEQIAKNFYDFILEQDKLFSL